MRLENEQFQDKLARLFPEEEYGSGAERKLTRTITFQVTDACNLRCTYCYQINKSMHRMDFETAKRFADMVLEASPDSCDYINPELSQGLVIEFIGGEPFLEIDLIDKITDYMIQKMIMMHHPWATKFMISICSNGVLYFDPKVQAYIKKHMPHLSFSISIDGNKELHDSCRVFPDGKGSYDIAIKGVEHFVNVLHGKMGSKMTLCPANIDKTAEAVKSLIELGYREIFCNCVYEEGWELPHAKILYNQLKTLADYIFDKGLFNNITVSIFSEDMFHPKKEDDIENWCGGTGMMLACDYKGDLYPCLRYMESSLGTDVEPMKIGDVYNGLMATDPQKRCVECLRKITRRSQSTDECFNCPIAEGCSWCSAYNYQTFGTADKRATYICIMHKARALANAYFWNKGHRLNEDSVRHKIYIPEEWALEIIDKDEWEMLNNHAKE